MNGEEKKAKASKDPIQHPQYICQYKIQNIVPNTFSNKESIAHKDSLHNLLEKVSLYSIVEGGGLLITSGHYQGKHKHLVDILYCRCFFRVGVFCKMEDLFKCHHNSPFGIHIKPTSSPHMEPTEKTHT